MQMAWSSEGSKFLFYAYGTQQNFLFINFYFLVNNIHLFIQSNFMYSIIGCYKNIVEIIDSANSQAQAEYLVREYSIAFGREWSIYSRKN